MINTVIIKQITLISVISLFTLTACQPTLEEQMEIVRTYGRRKEYVEAIGRLDYIIKGYPNYVPAYTHKASYLLVQGKVEKATAVANEAIKIDPRCFECYKLRGEAKDGREAILDFDKAIELNTLAIKRMKAVLQKWPSP